MVDGDDIPPLASLCFKELASSDRWAVPVLL